MMFPVRQWTTVLYGSLYCKSILKVNLPCALMHHTLLFCSVWCQTILLVKVRALALNGLINTQAQCFLRKLVTTLKKAHLMWEKSTPHDGLPLTYQGSTMCIMKFNLTVRGHSQNMWCCFCHFITPPYPLVAVCDSWQYTPSQNMSSEPTTPHKKNTHKTQIYYRFKSLKTLSINRHYFNALLNLGLNSFLLRFSLVRWITIYFDRKHYLICHWRDTYLQAWSCFVIDRVYFLDTIHLSACDTPPPLWHYATLHILWMAPNMFWHKL